MPSSAKEKRLAKKAKSGTQTPVAKLDANGKPIQDDAPATSGAKMDEVKRLADQMDEHGISDRVTTGVLSSISSSKDVKITSTSLVFHGRVLVTDSTLELTFGRRYGLLGENGCGKSTLLKAIAAREYPIPEHVDIYLLNEGAPPSDLGALEWVVKEAENEMDRLDKLAEKLLEDEGPESPVLIDLYDVSCDKPPYPAHFHRATRKPHRELIKGCSTWTKWTPPPFPPELLSFSQVLVSTRRPSIRRQRICLVDGG